MHIVKKQRLALRSLLLAADLRVSIGGADVSVAILDRPPAGLKVSEKNLPALYLYNAGERILDRDLSNEDRAPQLEIVLLARDQDDPQDQLDDLQEQIEIAISASDNLSGVCHEIHFEASSTVQDAGRVLYGVRSLTYRLRVGMTPGDPRY